MQGLGELELVSPISVLDSRLETRDSRPCKDIQSTQRCEVRGARCEVRDARAEEPRSYEVTKSRSQTGYSLAAAR